MALTTKKEFPSVKRMPYDPENGLLSKEEFKAKMRKKRELDAKMKAYEKTARAEIEREMEDPEPVVQEPVEPEPIADPVVIKPKVTRKKKSEV